MTTENQTTNSIEVITFSKTTLVGRNVAARAVDKSLNASKTLSLRPTRSVKKYNSFKPIKKMRSC